MKQPIKKKDFKKPSIASFKEKYGLTMKSNKDLVKSVADKPTDFIPLPQSIAYLKSKLFSVSYITGSIPLLIQLAIRQFLMVDLPVFDHPVTIVR